MIKVPVIDQLYIFFARVSIASSADVNSVKGSGRQLLKERGGFIAAVVPSVDPIIALLTVPMKEFTGENVKKDDCSGGIDEKVPINPVARVAAPPMIIGSAFGVTIDSDRK